MRHEPNTIPWKVGDLVIHDADRKEPGFLMRIVGHTPGGQAKTVYCVAGDTKRVFVSDIKYLHDPARFNISLESVAQAI